MFHSMGGLQSHRLGQQYRGEFSYSVARLSALNVGIVKDTMCKWTEAQCMCSRRFGLETFSAVPSHGSASSCDSAFSVKSEVALTLLGILPRGL